MKPVSEEELKEDLKFLRRMLADPKFDTWANELLDRGRSKSR